MRTISSRMLVCLSMLLGLIGCTTNSTPPPIVVGHVSDNTRADKAGEQAEWAIRLALHELDKDGALSEAFAGKKIQVNHTDTRGEIDAFESQAVRLFNINKSVAILGGLSTKEVSALDHVKAPILTFHGQPVAGASNQVFYLGMSARRQGEILGETLGADRVGRVVILHDERRSEGRSFVEALQDKMFKMRQDLIGQMPSFSIIRTNDEEDWLGVIERMTAPKPNAVVFVGSVQDFNSWHRACRKDDALKGVEVVYAGSDGDHRRFDVEGKSSVLLATAFYRDPANDKVQSFLKAYRALEPKAEADVHAALAYDGIRMLVDAMKKTTPLVAPEKIREELLKTKDFAGLNGALSITAERQVTRPLFVMRWQNGGLTFVKAFP